MPVTYSQDLRDRVLAAYDRSMKTKQIAHTFCVSPAWARRVKQCRRENGRTTPLARGGATARKIDPHRLAGLVAQYPDATLAELRDRLGVGCSQSAVCRVLKKLGLTFKKRRSTPRNRTARTSPSDARGGVGTSSGTTPADSSSSTRPGPRRT